MSATPIVFQPLNGAVAVNGTIDFGQDQFNRLGPRGVTVRNMSVTYLRVWAGSEDLLFENIDGAHFDINGKNVTVRGGGFGPCQAPRDDLACLSRIAGDSRNVLIEGTRIHGVTSTDLGRYHVDGMAIFGGQNITIRGTKFYGNMITNIRVQNCCGNTPIQNLTLENNWFGPPLQGDGVSIRGDGIDIDNPVPGLLIRNNSFAEGTGPQFLGNYAGSGARFVGNLFANGPCISGIEYSYNVFTLFSPYVGATACGSADKKVSSFGYVDPARLDFHIAGTSPAVGAGSPTNCPTNDIDLEARASRCDAGADQS